MNSKSGKFWQKASKLPWMIFFSPHRTFKAYPWPFWSETQHQRQTLKATQQKNNAQCAFLSGEETKKRTVPSWTVNRSLTTTHLSLMALLQEIFKLENFHPSFEQISKFKSKKENSLHLQKSRFLKIQTLSAEAPAATRCMSAWLACLESGTSDYVYPTTAMASLSAG